jgi:hypothetical protein
MDPKNLTKDEAWLLLIEDFLEKRKKDKTLAPELLTLVGQDLTTFAREFMLEHGIFKSEKAAYFATNALSLLEGELEEKAAKKVVIMMADCHYSVSPEMFDKLEEEWNIYLAEEVAEKGMYADLGELP